MIVVGEFQHPGYTDADLIIAKGQGNFETLNTEPGNLFFLFKVKRPLVADLVKLADRDTNADAIQNCNFYR